MFQGGITHLIPVDVGKHPGFGIGMLPNINNSDNEKWSRNQPVMSMSAT
jgi:hypothetical protein